MKTKPLLLIILSTFLNATGDLYINVKLKPMATNEYGEVLFQTYTDINTHGSYSCSYDKFGWLVVSADGTWDKRVALMIMAMMWLQLYVILIPMLTRKKRKLK